MKHFFKTINVELENDHHHHLQNKDDRSNEKLSVKIVFLITFLGCLLPLSWSPKKDFLHSVLFPLLYSVLVWLLPCCFFVLGVKKRGPFLLLPWILVSCVLGMVAEMFLLWAAVSCLSPDPPLVMLSPSVDLTLLLLLALPLPVLLTVPIKAFVYMDRQGRRSESESCYLQSCCFGGSSESTVKEENASQEREGEDEEDEIDIQEAETEIENQDGGSQRRLISGGGTVNSVMLSSMAATTPVSSLADRALEALMGRNDREEWRRRRSEERAERIVEERRRVMMMEAERARTAHLDLFDLSDIRMDGIGVENSAVDGNEEEESTNRHLDVLPPSYSLAEGLDQLPDYTEAEVNISYMKRKYYSGCLSLSGEPS